MPRKRVDARITAEDRAMFEEILTVTDLHGDLRKTGYFMLAALRLGSLDTVMLARVCALSREFIRPRVRRLREQGVWRGRTLNAEWEDEEAGATAFMLDVMVAEGLLRRSDGNPAGVAVEAVDDGGSTGQP